MFMQFVRIAQKSLALTAVAAACATLLVAPAVHAQALKSYDSTKKDFWEHPPADWFLGDETSGQKGLTPKAPPATGVPLEEIQATLKSIKLPKGFHISLWAHDIPSARQMACSGTLKRPYILSKR